MKTTSNTNTNGVLSRRVQTTFWVSLSVVMAIGLALSSVTSALAVPQGFLPSAVGWQPVATLDDFLTTNVLDDPLLPQINISIGLPLNNEDQLTTLLDQLYDPASTNYGQYLTPDQFTGMFGPTPDQYQTVIDFVQMHGLAVTGVYSDRIILDVSGTVDQIQNAFGVTLEVYRDPTDLRYFFAPDVEPSVPPMVPILDISGMNDHDVPIPVLAGTAILGTGLIPGGGVAGFGNGISGIHPTVGTLNGHSKNSHFGRRLDAPAHQPSSKAQIRHLSTQPSQLVPNQLQPLNPPVITFSRLPVPATNAPVQKKPAHHQPPQP